MVDSFKTTKGENALKTGTDIVVATKSDIVLHMVNAKPTEYVFCCLTKCKMKIVPAT